MLVYYEHIDLQRVMDLSQHPNVHEDVKKQLMKYIKLWDARKKAFKVEYDTSKISIGRKYAKGSLSLQNFKRTIRETLVYDTHTDIDIKNCHYVLLEQYCKKNGIVCDYVSDYVNNRDERLHDLMTQCKVVRKIAKELIIVLLYGGLVNEYCAEHGFSIDIDLPEWVEPLNTEIKKITDIICLKEAVIHKEVGKLKKKDKNASTISYVLQVIEDNILMTLCSKLKQDQLKVETLCFDGVLILNDEVDLSSLSAYCFEKTNYRVEFEVKPMELHFEAVTLDTECIELEHLDEFNQNYCMTLEYDTSFQTYQTRKKYIEHFVCKVMQPEPMYMFQNGIHMKIDPLNPGQLALLLKPISSGYLDKRGNPVSFYEKWSNDIKHRLYRTFDFIPFPIDKPIHDKSILNVFEGFNPDIYAEPMDKETILKRITPFLDLAQELCGNDEHAMYFHRFIAQIFQEPEYKPPVCIIFKGKQGTGKNAILDAIGNMLNPIHYITSSSPNDFFGTHAEGYYRKLLVNLNEAEGKDTFDFEGKMKSFITEPTITINPKNVRPTQIRNMARTIITTNKPNPIPIDVRSKDRRYVVYQNTDVYLRKSSKFWLCLREHFLKPEFMSALYQWYMKIDNRKFDWAKKRPLTKAYRDLCNLYSPVEALFFQEYYDKKMWICEHETKNAVDTMVIPKHLLFTQYETFCKKNRFLRDETKATSTRGFSSKLIDLEIPMTQVFMHGETCWRLCPEEIYSFVEKKRWINSYKLDEVEAEEVIGEDAADGYFL